jgi:peptidoglycan/xylan/chitin deacetylase (PgdA/CDA1 family)
MKKIIKNFISKNRLLKHVKHFHHNKLVIFNYHRIRGPNTTSIFDDAVYGPNAFRFKEEMEWLKKETRIISEEELLENTYKNKTVKGLCSMVTFDDGYLDNFEIAFPILKKLNIPAMFFIPTGHIDERKVGWWDVVAYLFKQTTLKSFFFKGREYCIDDPKVLTSKFNMDLKMTDADRVDEYLCELALALELSLPDTKLQDAELMTWEHIKILGNNGMTIGTHSHDHSILSRQNNIRLKAQLEKSIDILENVLDKKINSIAYPVGGYAHFNDQTKAVSKEVGLKLGFSYLTGINKLNSVDPFNVKRMRLRPEWINLDIPLAFPQYFLKNRT